MSFCFLFLASGVHRLRMVILVALILTSLFYPDLCLDICCVRESLYFFPGFCFSCVVNVRCIRSRDCCRRRGERLLITMVESGVFRRSYSSRLVVGIGLARVFCPGDIREKRLNCFLQEKTKKGLYCVTASSISRRNRPKLTYRNLTNRIVLDLHPSVFRP